MKIIETNGDEFFFDAGKWFWIDLDDRLVGPFPSKLAARKDARSNFWLDDEGRKLRGKIMSLALDKELRRE